MSVEIFRFDQITLEGALAEFKDSFRASEISSKFNTNTSQRVPNRTSRNLLVVLQEIAKDNIFLGYVGRNKVAVERKTDQGETETVILSKNSSGTIQITAGTIDSNGIITEYKLGIDNGGKKGTTILAGLVGFAFYEPEFKAKYEEIKRLLQLNPNSNDFAFGNNKELLEQGMALLSDNMYRRIKYPADCGSDAIIVFTENEKNGVKKLRQTDLDIKIKEAVSGYPNYFKEATTTASAITSNTDFNGKYSLSASVYNEDEKKLIPMLQPWYELPEYVVDCCEMIMHTSEFPSPMRTFAFVGPAGTGKTEGARAVCAGLSIPYDHMTCNAQSEIFDFMGQIFPCENKGKELSYEEVRKEMGLPSTDDIMNDPTNAYMKIHGLKPDGFVDEGKLIVDMVEKVMEKVSSICGEMSSGFSYIESGLIKAARNGYGYEIQEIGSVQRAGVAVGLNALLESGQNNFITLPTGEVIRKHPNCTIIFTSNVDYEGCENLNQAVLSRMSMYHIIDLPTSNQMADRVMKRTGFKDIHFLKRMSQTIQNISSYCKSNSISDGVCGVRELENWVMRVMVKEKILGTKADDELIGQCGICTVVNKASQLEEDRSEVESVYRKDWAF